MTDRDATHTSNHSRRAVLSGTALAAVVGLSGCLDGLGDTSYDASETTTGTYATRNTDSLGLSTMNGGVTVRGEPGDEIELTVRKEATDGDRLDDISTDVSLVDSTLRIAVETETGSMEEATESTRADLDLTVPDSLTVNEVDAPNGGVEVGNVAAVGRIDASNGDVLVEDVDGTVGIDASRGTITARNLGGGVTVGTSTGDITVEEATGSVTVTTSTGDVSVATVGRAVDVETSTGDVDVAAVEGAVEVDTSTGDIDVERVDGDAILETVSGDVTAANVGGTVRRQ